MVRKKNHTHFSVVAMINGILAGLSSNYCSMWKCNSMGFIYHWISRRIKYMLGFSEMVTKVKVDDPLDAFAVHYGAGLWGVLSVGLFDIDKWCILWCRRKTIWYPTFRMCSYYSMDRSMGRSYFWIITTNVKF